MGRHELYKFLYQYVIIAVLRAKNYTISNVFYEYTFFLKGINIWENP